MKKARKETPAPVFLGKSIGEVYLVHIENDNENLAPSILCAASTMQEASQIIENIKPQIPAGVTFGYKRISLITPKDRPAPQH